eukprot:5292087-Ditylum_brightwellii.AAC.1
MKLLAMTMINPATLQFEIAPVPCNKYPQPRKIIYDDGSEFKKDFKQLCKDFGLKSKPTTVRNPQANAILEHELEKRSFTKDDPWGEVLATTAWAICSTYHTTLGATPGQLIY